MDTRGHADLLGLTNYLSSSGSNDASGTLAQLALQLQSEPVNSMESISALPIFKSPSAQLYMLSKSLSTLTFCFPTVCLAGSYPFSLFALYC